jgi:signal transduction histidine kinase
MASLWETPQDQLIGQHLYELAGPVNSTILDAFLKAGYRLHNHNVSISVDHETTRHFVVNAVGQVNRGALRAIWGSCIEVTDHVEMERRLVAALEEQQERIGHDLHDSVGQLLTGIRILSSNLAENFHQRGDPHAETVQKVAAFASEASEYVRNIYRGLAPPQLFRDGLTVALEELAASTNGIGDITCIFKGDTIEHLSNRDINLQLYRIAQEATNNALKHADASVIEIMLTTEKDYIVLEVTDDGAGFDSNQNYTESLGLYSMQRRASCIQASLDILSRPDYGTTIRVEVPTSG